MCFVQWAGVWNECFVPQFLQGNDVVPAPLLGQHCQWTSQVFSRTSSASASAVCSSTQCCSSWVCSICLAPHGNPSPPRLGHWCRDYLFRFFRQHRFPFVHWIFLLLDSFYNFLFDDPRLFPTPALQLARSQSCQPRMVSRREVDISVFLHINKLHSILFLPIYAHVQIHMRFVGAWEGTD